MSSAKQFVFVPSRVLSVHSIVFRILCHNFVSFGEMRRGGGEVRDCDRQPSKFGLFHKLLSTEHSVVVNSDKTTIVVVITIIVSYSHRRHHHILELCVVLKDLYWNNYHDSICPPP